MSGLAALLAGHNPPAVHQWHNHAHVEDVEHAVEKAGWAFRYLDGWTIEDRATFCKTTASVLDLPDRDTADLDRLCEGVSGLRVDGNGMVLLWDGWSPLARHDDDAFQTVLASMRERTAATDKGRLAVILRGEGPTLDIEELPIKH
jgi:hypothetical protein